MKKFIAKIVVMLMLFGISIMFFGQGFTTYLVNTGLGTVTVFSSLFGNAIIGETAPSSAIDFVFSLVQTIGIILLYFLVAYIITGIFILKKK